MQSTDCSLLSGKVLKSSLPAIPGRPVHGAPKLKRLLLSQGELAQIHDGEPAIRYLACLELRLGTTRGNHYHKSKNEFLYLIAGQVELEVEDLAIRERASTSLQPGDLVFIPAGVAHGFRVVASGHGVEFSAEPFDAADIFPHALIPPVAP